VTDTHAHLDALEEPGNAIARAQDAGVSRIVTIGTGVESCRVALDLAEQHEQVYAALGIDPHQAGSAEADRLDELRELLRHPKVVAVGEAGLDYHYGHGRRDAQVVLFEAQLELARALALPVVVHTRAADDDTAAILREHDGTVVMHCFSEPGLLGAAAASGWYVSFAGNLTYPKARDLRSAAAAVTADRILVETDTPYLAPQPVRGRRNEPANLVHTVTALAATRRIPADELEEQLEANAAAAFHLP
jgi:TatD DNase family protein